MCLVMPGGELCSLLNDEIVHVPTMQEQDQNQDQDQDQDLKQPARSTSAPFVAMKNSQNPHSEQASIESEPERVLQRAAHSSNAPSTGMPSLVASSCGDEARPRAGGSHSVGGLPNERPARASSITNASVGLGMFRDVT